MTDEATKDGAEDAARPVSGFAVPRLDARPEDSAAVDLSPLRSARSARRGLEEAILAAAVAELARREAAARRPAPAVRRAGADGENLLALIARWAAPTLAAATVLAALSAAGLALARRDSGAIVETRAPAETLVGALELPEPASTWLVEDRSPGTDDLILAVQEDLP
jgi:hypothetical protein